MQPAKGFVRATREGSLRKILAYAKKNRFEKDAYRSEDGRRRDAVGCLFSTRQLNDLKRRNLLLSSVGDVADAVGERNVKFVTGMTVDELTSLTIMNDECRSRLLSYVRNELFKIKKGSAK